MRFALRTILAGFYASHLREWKRITSDVWFSLIGASTLLTYQHHVIDVVGGFLLAALCFYVVSDAPWRQPFTRNARVGAYYAAGAAALAGLALVFWPWAGILLWPAISLAIVGGAYVGLGPGIFRKHFGRLPIASRLLLAPVVIGQQLSRLHYARRSRPWDAINRNLLIGRTLNAREAHNALASGVTAIIDLTSELPEATPFAMHANYRNQPILDLTAPTPEQLREAIAFIDGHARGGVVYVHCKAGYSRSAAVVAAYLLHTKQAHSAEEALGLVRGCRSGIVVRPEVVRALSAYVETLIDAVKPLAGPIQLAQGRAPLVPSPSTLGEG